MAVTVMVPPAAQVPLSVSETVAAVLTTLEPRSIAIALVPLPVQEIAQVSVPPGAVTVRTPEPFSALIVTVDGKPAVAVTAETPASARGGAVLAAREIPMAATIATGKSLRSRRLFIG